MGMSGFSQHCDTAGACKSYFEKAKEYGEDADVDFSRDWNDNYWFDKISVVLPDLLVRFRTIAKNKHLDVSDQGAFKDCCKLRNTPSKRDATAYCFNAHRAGAECANPGE